MGGLRAMGQASQAITYEQALAWRKQFVKPDIGQATARPEESNKAGELSDKRQIRLTAREDMTRMKEYLQAKFKEKYPDELFEQQPAEPQAQATTRKRGTGGFFGSSRGAMVGGS